MLFRHVQISRRLAAAFVAQGAALLAGPGAFLFGFFRCATRRFCARMRAAQKGRVGLHYFVAPAGFQPARAFGFAPELLGG
jgi:hypothetical protein